MSCPCTWQVFLRVSNESAEGVVGGVLETRDRATTPSDAIEMTPLVGDTGEEGDDSEMGKQALMSCPRACFLHLYLAKVLDGEFSM